MPSKMSQEDFLVKAKAIHGETYDYSKTEYVKAQAKVTITCLVHGDFTQKATNHTVQKQGCPICAGNSPLDTEQYVNEVSSIHNGQYSYDKTVYTKMHSPITITCLQHGDFEQLAYVHKQGHGCPECSMISKRIKLKGRPDAWTYTGWEEAANISKYFNDFCLYVVECWNEEEHFLKVGKTFTTLSRRFIKGGMPYQWKSIYEIKGDATYISNKECELHTLFKASNYTPLIKFNGSNECFHLSIKELLHNELNT